MLEISKRLKSITDCVKTRTLADIGTDHAYLPVYLCIQNRIDRAIASDVNAGPLQKAKENIVRYQLCDQIETRLGSGLSTIAENEMGTCVIAGMGGMLLIDILAKHMNVAKGFEQLVLQPQHDLKEVRVFLHKNSFKINGEKMLVEDGKYYTVMDCVKGCEPEYTVGGYVFGERLIEQKDETLGRFIAYEIGRLQKIIGGLENVTKTDDTQQRLDELNRYLQLCLEVMGCL